MDEIKRIIVFGICWLSTVSAVAQVNTVTAKYRSASKSTYRSSQTSFVLPSFVVHGITPSTDSSAMMPRRLDDSGNMVVTPGLGFEYIDKESGFLFVSALIKDCYDNLAGTIQLGKSMNLGKFAKLGLTLGVYARETPMICQAKQVFGTTTNARGVRSTAMTTQTECSTVDDLSEPFMTNLGSSSVDIIPMPFLHLTTSVFKSREFQIDLKFMSNYFLNEVGIGIPF